MGERGARAHREGRAEVRPPNRVNVDWKGAHTFETGREGGPTALADGDSISAPSPVDMFLGALGSCISVDVVDILAKRRTPVETFSVEVVGDRVETVPRHLKHVNLNFRITGAGIERVHAERAIELSVTKYCSIRSSLDPEIPVEWNLSLNELAAS